MCCFSRKELGLPLEEPGRYADKTKWGKNPYDPNDPRFRNDYWGDPSTLKDEIRRDREPRVATVVSETAVVEDIEEVEVDETEEPVADDPSTMAKKTTKNRDGSVSVDDVRTMFTMQPEVSFVLNSYVPSVSLDVWFRIILITVISYLYEFFSLEIRRVCGGLHSIQMFENLRYFKYLNGITSSA